MKIALPTENGYLCPHFGKSPYFTIAEIENNKVIKRELIENPGHETGSIPEFLSKKGVECVVSSGMGIKAQEIFKNSNIEIILGAEGKIDDIIKCFIDGTIKSGNSSCSGSEHNCGSHESGCHHE
jgi:predicted Fe-Mo cluster-binding NifX family protein